MDASLSRVTKTAIHDRLVSAIILSSVGLPHVGSQIFQKNPFRLCKLDCMKPDYVRLWQTFFFLYMVLSPCCRRRLYLALNRLLPSCFWVSFSTPDCCYASCRFSILPASFPPCFGIVICVVRILVLLLGGWRSFWPMLLFCLGRHFIQHFCAWQADRREFSSVIQRAVYKETSLMVIMEAVCDFIATKLGGAQLDYLSYSRVLHFYGYGYRNTCMASLMGAPTLGTLNRMTYDVQQPLRLSQGFL